MWVRIIDYKLYYYIRAKFYNLHPNLTIIIMPKSELKM